jgi:hypothetical protein
MGAWDPHGTRFAVETPCKWFPHGVNSSTDPVLRLEDQRIVPGLEKFIGSRKPCQTCPNDNYFFRSFALEVFRNPLFYNIDVILNGMFGLRATSMNKNVERIR